MIIKGRGAAQLPALLKKHKNCVWRERYTQFFCIFACETNQIMYVHPSIYTEFRSGATSGRECDVAEIPPPCSIFTTHRRAVAWFKMALLHPYEGRGGAFLYGRFFAPVIKT